MIMVYYGLLWFINYCYSYLKKNKKEKMSDRGCSGIGSRNQKNKLIFFILTVHVLSQLSL